MFNDSTGNVTTTTPPPTNDSTSLDEGGALTGNATSAPTRSPAMSAAGWLGTYISEPFLNDYQNVPYFVKLIFPTLGILAVMYTLRSLRGQPVTTSGIVAHLNTVAFCIAFLPETLVVAAFYYIASCALSKEIYHGGRKTHLLFSLTMVGLAIATALENTFHERRALVWTYVTAVVIHALFVRREVRTNDESQSPYVLHRVFFLDAVVAITVGILYERNVPNATWILIALMSLVKGMRLFHYYSPVPEITVIPAGLETHAANATGSSTGPSGAIGGAAPMERSEFHTFRTANVHPVSNPAASVAATEGASPPAAQLKRSLPFQHYRVGPSSAYPPPMEAPLDLRRAHYGHYNDADDDGIENEDVTAV